METKINKQKNKVRYYSPEAMPLILCAACLGVVLDHSEKAKQLFNEIVECYKLPGCIEVMNKIVENAPKGEQLLKSIVKESGYDYKKPPEGNNLGIPKMRGLIKGGAVFATKYRKTVLSQVLKKKDTKNDLQILEQKINEFMKVGFNNKDAQVSGIYKVPTNGSISLLRAIMYATFHEYCRLNLEELGKIEVITSGKKGYNLQDVFDDDTTKRIHRDLVENYKRSGFIFKRDQRIRYLAELWYQCRVMYSGPEEYCRKLLLENGRDLDSANISNDIKEYDEAVGYSRGGKRK